MASLGCTVLDLITSDISRLRGMSSLRGISTKPSSYYNSPLPHTGSRWWRAQSARRARCWSTTRTSPPWCLGVCVWAVVRRGVCQSALYCGITCSLYCCAGGLVCGRAGGAAAAVFGGQVAVSCELWDPGCCSCSDVITPERSLDTGICMHHRAPRATATATAFLLRHTLSTHASPHAPAVRYPPQQTPNWSSCRRRRSPEHLRLSNTFTFPPIGPPPPAATSWCTRIRNPSRHAHASHTRWPSAS